MQDMFGTSKRSISGKHSRKQSSSSVLSPSHSNLGTLVKDVMHRKSMQVAYDAKIRTVVKDMAEQQTDVVLVERKDSASVLTLNEIVWYYASSPSSAAEPEMWELVGVSESVPETMSVRGCAMVMQRGRLSAMLVRNKVDKVVGVVTTAALHRQMFRDVLATVRVRVKNFPAEGDDRCGGVCLSVIACMSVSVSVCLCLCLCLCSRLRLRLCVLSCFLGPDIPPALPDSAALRRTRRGRLFKFLESWKWQVFIGLLLLCDIVFLVVEFAGDKGVDSESYQGSGLWVGSLVILTVFICASVFVRCVVVARQFLLPLLNPCLCLLSVDAVLRIFAQRRQFVTPHNVFDILIVLGAFVLLFIKPSSASAFIIVTGRVFRFLRVLRIFFRGAKHSQRLQDIAHKLYRQNKRHTEGLDMTNITRACRRGGAFPRASAAHPCGGFVRACVPVCLCLVPRSQSHSHELSSQESRGTHVPQFV